MAICGGDVTQYNALKRGTVDDYCIKLKSHIDSIMTPEAKKFEDLKNMGRKK